ncbi:MAG: T9SS type A sorting domain-containing protein [Cytophagales bacterium]|nr:T9SS type A sorting domain-containing protein [Cytophagales bacterium]
MIVKSLILLLSFLPAFWLKALSQGFSEVSISAGINHQHINTERMGGGGAFFDYDNDGYPDIYLTGGEIRDMLYHNNGNGTFTEVGVAAGLSLTDSISTMGVITGDIDNDGYRDIFVTTWVDEHNLLFKNNGDGTFQEISASAGISDTAWSTAASFGDFNLDGFPDIYVVNYVDPSKPTTDDSGFYYVCSPNYLYMNNGNETFSEVASLYGVADTGCGLAIAFTNCDQDSDVDIYIANDFGAWVLPNSLYQNNFPSPDFSNVSVSSSMNDAIYGMGIAIGDYDEDGDLDYYVTNLGRNVLRNNQGNGLFIDLTDSAGVTNTYTDSNLFAVGWGTAFLDYDNDTYLDLFVANGHIPADSIIANAPSNPDVLYKNNGDATFTDVSVLLDVDDTSMARGFAYGDYDNDGDLDLLIMVADTGLTSSHALLYQNNNSNNNHWLKVKLQGTTNNRDAYGSLVRIISNGRNWIREIDGGSSHLSHHSTIAHFGLGIYTAVDTIEVTWPDGKSQFLSNIGVDTTILIVEDTAITGHTTQIRNLQFEIDCYPNPFTKHITISYHLNENTHIKLLVYDIMGKKIKSLADEFQSAGDHIIKWEGTNDKGINIRPGFYTCRIETNGMIINKKIIFLLR